MSSFSSLTVAALGLSAVVAWSGAIVEVLTPPQDHFLAVRELSVDLDARTVTQQIVPVHAGRMQATWAARIDRDGEERPLCEGSGVGTYDGTRRTWPVDDWAGDHCPPLLPGDRLVASWKWADGPRGQVTAETVIE